MRVGLILDQIIFEHRGRYSTDEAFIRFVEAVAAPLFDQIEFCSRVLPAESDGPYVLSRDRFTVRALPWYRDVATLCVKAPVLIPKIAAAFRAWMTRWDLVMACGIHPITPLVLRMADRRRIPAQLWIRGDAAADAQAKYSGVRRVAARAIIAATTAAIPGGTPVVSIGRDDYPFLSRMGRLQIAFDSKFVDGDIVCEPRGRPDSQAPVRLLYVGRISAEKGLDVLLRAVEQTLTSAFRGVSLTLAGADFVGSAYGDQFLARAARSSAAESIAMRGYVPFGPRLWSLYDSHDVLVLPSFTEGFPQVLLEAMARGLPIVATAVGGVPRLVRDGENGLLVPAGRADALAAAVTRLAGDEALYARLSRNGLECARSHARAREVASIASFTTGCLGRAA